MAEATGSKDLFSSLYERSFGRLTTRSALAIVAIVTFIGQAPVLGHYFFGDDFVPLADIASRTNGEYLKALFLLNDETPNWRFLTGLFYLGAYRAFSLDALPYLLASVVVHIGTASLIFYFVRRAAGDIWLAVLAGTLFGLMPASVPTVGQVTAINNVFGGFLLMLSIVLVNEAFDRKPLWPWVAGAAVAFAGAIAANESVAVLAAVPVIVAFWRGFDTEGTRNARWLIRSLAVSAPIVLLGGVALIGFGVCQCTEAADGGTFGLGSHIFDNVLIYLGRLLYPIGMEQLGDVGGAHLIAGLVVVGLAFVALVRGPNLVRVLALFLVIAMIPYLPLKLWSAPRYVYLASIPFAMLSAFYVREALILARKLSSYAPVVVAVAAAAVLIWYGVQTWSQNEEYDELTRDWETLVAGLEETYPELPPGSTVYVRGGALTDPLLQCVVMPFVGELIWGDTKLFSLPTDAADQFMIRPGYAVFFVDEEDGAYVPQTLSIASPDASEVTLLPHVPPDAEGNLCREDVPSFP